MNTFKSLCAAVLLLALPAGNAMAEGFSVIDWSARGVALAGGLVARANDASAVAYNPAGITQLPGTRLMLGTTVVSPMGKVDTLVRGRTATTSIARNHWLMPHFYATHQFNDRLWGGVGMFSRFGLGNGFSRDWPGSAGLVDVKLETITLNPNLAWKVTDKLSLAAGVEVTGAMMKMRKRINVPGLVDNTTTLDGQGAALSGNIALHYTFNENWALGLTYRSRMRINVHGDSKWYHQRTIPGVADMRDSGLHGTLSLPESFAAALAWSPTSRLSLEGGLVYTAWSQYRHLDIYLEDPVNNVNYGPKHWRDTWTFNGSVEYQALDWLALRGGFGYETSPANKAHADYMVPTNGRWYITTGVGVSWNNWTLDVGYSYLNMRNLNFDHSEDAQVHPGRQHSAYANIVSVSLGYTF